MNPAVSIVCYNDRVAVHLLSRSRSVLLLLPFNSQGQHADHSVALLFAGGTCMRYLSVSGPLDSLVARNYKSPVSLI